MTRHARNCTAGSVYTYNEKKRDAAESGYGTNERRLGKDSVNNFDCCSLTLQPCRKPVVTKNGYLFDKEAILQYIITKKNEYSRKLKQFEQMKKSENTQVELEMLKKQQMCVQNFINSSKANSVDTAADVAASASPSSISNMAHGNDKKLPSFWVPSESPNAGVAKVEKPDRTILCPISQMPLLLKDLIDVKFTLMKNSSEKQSLITKEVRYMCPVTHDALSNAVPCAVLRPTGDVVTLECVEKLIRKDMIHPLTGQKLKEKDIIILQRGGTGYATTNVNLQAKETRPALQV